MSDMNPDKKPRNPNIEVLRVFLMFLIVLGHCCYTSVTRDSPVAQLLQTMTVFSVDAFVFISGWYSIRFRLDKVVNLLGVGVFASVVLWLASPAAIGRWHFHYSLGWFGNSYLGLMLVAPLLNEGLERFPRNICLGVLCACAALTLCAWMPLRDIGIDLAPTGYTSNSLGTMVFVYLIARFLAKDSFGDRISLKQGGALFAVAWACMVGFVLAGHWFRDGGTLFGWFLRADGWSYQSPFVILTAIMAFCLFFKLSIPKWLGGICVKIAPSMFAVYLLHAGPNPETHRAIASALQRAFLREGQLDAMNVIPIAVASAVCVFAACLILDLVRRSVVKVLVGHLCAQDRPTAVRRNADGGEGEPE